MECNFGDSAFRHIMVRLIRSNRFFTDSCGDTLAPSLVTGARSLVLLLLSVRGEKMVFAEFVEDMLSLSNKYGVFDEGQLVSGQVDCFTVFLLFFHRPAVIMDSTLVVSGV